MYVIKNFKNCFIMVLNIKTTRSKIEYYRLCSTNSQRGSEWGGGRQERMPLLSAQIPSFIYSFQQKFCKTILWCTSLGSLRPLANPGPATDS